MNRSRIGPRSRGTDAAVQRCVNALAEEFHRRSMLLFTLLSGQASLRDIEDYLDALDATQSTEMPPRPH